MSEQLKVMISSTALDLPEHREKVMEACLGLVVLSPDMMEHLTATNATALEVSLGMVDRADVYMGVIGFRYGYVPEGESISITEAEYNRAVERNIPRLIFLMSDDHSIKPADKETGEGAAKLEKFKERLKKDRVVGFFDSPDDLKAQVIQALVPYIKLPQSGGIPRPLIHTLPTHLEIEGRDAESAEILRAMSAAKHRVYAFAAPGGFGKTALLAKVVQSLSPDGESLLEKLTFPNGETIESRTSALLHIDCRNEVKLSELFAKAGRLIGQEKQFEDVYNSDAVLSDKLQEIFGRLSSNGQNSAWFVFDNFESTLDERGEVANAELRDFFSSVFAGSHNVRALIVGREVPKFSPRERVEELEVVGENLFEGLPIDDCVNFLKKNGAAEGLSGSDEEVTAILKAFSERVHRIPLALVWAVGYLEETSFTLQEVLNRSDLLADFDKDQTEAADRYENKGLKRLHYEQLKIQPTESLPLLNLLAFFKRAVPKGALAHVMDELELNKTLTRLERNRLLTRKESADAYTRYLNDPLATNLYALHPVICENEFFSTLLNREMFYATAAKECWERANDAARVNYSAYAVGLYDCAEKLYEYLVEELHRVDLLNNYAATSMNKGVALTNLNRSAEAILEYDKAIEIRERLVNQESQTHLAHDLAMAYMNKGVALWNLSRLTDAIAQYDKAISILEPLVIQEQQSHLANDLAKAYTNKGNALTNLRRLDEAIAEYDRAISIREQLIYQEEQSQLANNLALTYLNKGVALKNLNKLTQAITEYEKAIAILEQLVIQEQQTYLANYLAMAYMNKGNALLSLNRLGDAIAEYDKAIAIREQLVNQEQQTHLANYLAKTYMNKGHALLNLGMLGEAIAEFDTAIAILERLVIQERQTHLANDLAMAYMNKGVTLEKQLDLDGALACFEKSVERRMFSVEQLNMFWVMTKLFESLRYRLNTLLQLHHWSQAAEDIMRFHRLFTSFIEREGIDDGLKEDAGKQFTQMISNLRDLDLEKRELLYAELGDEAEIVRTLVDTAGSEINPTQASAEN